MLTHRWQKWLHWTLSVPAVAVVLLAATWGRDPGPVILVIEGAFLIGAVLAAVRP